jgi:two-component system sensor histidine kinase KdpD
MGLPTSALARIADYSVAILAVVAVTAFGLIFRVQFGLASIALLYLLPVLLTATRGGIGTSLATAGGAALAYNFFMLPPRFTLRVFGYDNIVSLIVLFAVAIVTSRLASGLKAREGAAVERARAGVQAAALASALTAQATLADADRTGLAFLADHFGTVILIALADADRGRPQFSSLDLAALAWSAHNGDATGHASAVMAAADWSFVPMARGAEGDVLALARPEDGSSRHPAEIERLQTLAALFGQARDRLKLDAERQARQRLEELDALRGTLLASLAHDFRTPLTLLRSGIEAWRATPPGEESIAGVLGQVHRIEHMLADLIGLARIEGGAVDVAREPVDLIDIVAAALDDSDTGDSARQILTDVAIDLPLVDADPVLLRHMLVNLLDNAAHYGGPHIRVSARSAGDVILLSVGDDGPGIARGEESAIFDRFVRFAVGDRVGGTGLGLAIVQGFAKAMGADVTAANRANGPGAEFTIALPIAVAAGERG